MAFIISGIPPIAAALFLCLIYIVNTIPTPEGGAEGAPDGAPEGAAKGMQNTSEEFEMGRLHRAESFVTPHNGAYIFFGLNFNYLVLYIDLILL